MLEITEFLCEGLASGCVTDRMPRFRFAYTGGGDVTAVITVNGESFAASAGELVAYTGKPLLPFTEYTAVLEVTGNGAAARRELTFATGRLDTPWQAMWISDGSYVFREKRVSPRPMVFCKKFGCDKAVIGAHIYATAIGVFELTLNGKKVGDEYFAPDFTAYKKNLYYTVYDVKDMLGEHNELYAEVAGGWAVGSFVFTRKNRITAKRQALLLELRLDYADGTHEVIATDGSWGVSEEGRVRAADLYDGEVYDARIALGDIAYRAATPEKIKIHPTLSARIGLPVKRHERFEPVEMHEAGGALIYDMGQNFAGVVSVKLNGVAGQKVTVRHAEILNADGTLNTAFLRSAKATVEYICRDGEQEYSPRFTYMGFRYVSVEGVKAADVEVSAYALYSDLPATGEFECSDPLINKLSQNIIWSAKSNFVDIPTDCPQRDERMGWTGDIAMFAPTACYNFDMSRFFDKWLADMRAEQLRTGGIRNTVPIQGYGFPATMPAMAVDFWGDACILVPYAEYMARGDIEVLRKMYPAMKKYVKACKFWAGLLSVGKHRYIWNTPAILHFGDWVSPDVPKMSQWQKRAKWTATASLKNTSSTLAEIAAILGHAEDAAYYKKLSKKVAGAYVDVFTDGNGKLKNEFQTAYVLPLQFGMFEGESRKNAAANLVRLVEANGYRIATGIPGTPYILFALADNGYADTAYRMLMNTECPSWLYEVKAGATTVWERWDGLNKDGVCEIAGDGTGGMVSYNHYVFGSVGAFLYRRVLGVEPLEGGYRAFRVRPVLGGGLTYARGSVRTPYGDVKVDWHITDDSFTVNVTVPDRTRCMLTMPDGTEEELGAGEHSAACKL